MGAYDHISDEAVGYTQMDDPNTSQFPELTALFAESPADTDHYDTTSAAGKNQLDRSLIEIVIQDTHAERQRAALRALVALADEYGPSTRFDTAIVAALDDPDPPVRQKAAWAIGRVADSHPESFPASLERLSRVLVDDHYTVRAYGVDAVGRVGREHPSLVADTVNEVITALDDEFVKVRRNATWALGWVGRRDPSVVADSVSALGNALEDVVVVRRTAVWALGLVGGADPDLVTAVTPDIVLQLSDQAPDVRRNAAGTLGRIGQADPAVVSDVRPRLSEIFTDEGELVSVRAMAAVAYWSATDNVTGNLATEGSVPVHDLLAGDYCPSTFLELLATLIAETPSIFAPFVDGLREHRDHDERHARSAVHSALETIEG